jgi:hypothetical protein
MDTDSRSREKNFQHVTSLALGGYQLIEALLKTYLRNYFAIAKYRLGADLHFGFSGDDYDQAALGTLLKVFSKTCADRELVKDLQAEVKHRDHVAHQALLVLYRHQPCSPEELQAQIDELSVRADGISGLLRRLDEAHRALVASHSEDK